MKALQRVGWLIGFMILIGEVQGQNDSIAPVPYKTHILPTPSFTYSDQTDFVVGAYALLQF